MITITRLLARQLRAVCRRAGISTRSGRVRPLAFSAGPAGLTVIADSTYATIVFHEPAALPPDQFAVPFEVLAACEGSRPDLVALERCGDGKVQVTWSDRGVPQVVEYDVPETQTEITEPAAWKQVSADLLHALQEAKETTAPQSLRTGVDYIQLRGGTGEIVATDTHQLLVQSGFEFPWTEDVLIPSTVVFRSPEFAGHDKIEIGKTDKHVVIRVGSWQVYLLIEKERRFPKVDDIIPLPSAATTRLSLDPQDAAFLTTALPRLPVSNTVNFPVTLDFNGHVTVSAKAAEQARVTELVLSRSTYSGEPIRLGTDRRFLERAARLGFTEVYLQGDSVPLLCEDPPRKYIWQPLEAVPKYEAGVEVIRIDQRKMALATARASDKHPRNPRQPHRKQEFQNAPKSDQWPFERPGRV